MKKQIKMVFHKTQKEAIVAHMEEFGSVTSFEAFLDYGITRLSSIINKLRKKDGLKIESTQHTRKNRFGNTVNYVSYRIKK